jgi:hypothetical protein
LGFASQFTHSDEGPVLTMGTLRMVLQFSAATNLGGVAALYQLTNSLYISVSLCSKKLRLLKEERPNFKRHLLTTADEFSLSAFKVRDIYS